MIMLFQKPVHKNEVLIVNAIDSMTDYDPVAALILIWSGHTQSCLSYASTFSKTKAT